MAKFIDDSPLRSGRSCNAAARWRLLLNWKPAKKFSIWSQENDSGIILWPSFEKNNLKLKFSAFLRFEKNNLAMCNRSNKFRSHKYFNGLIFRALNSNGASSVLGGATGPV